MPRRVGRCPTALTPSASLPPILKAPRPRPTPQSSSPTCRPSRSTTRRPLGEDDAAVSGNVITDAATGDADTAPDSDPLTVTAPRRTATPSPSARRSRSPAAACSRSNANGSYSFDPGTAYNGLDDGETAIETITYTVDDGNGGTDTATLIITITGANDAPVIDRSEHRPARSGEPGPALIRQRHPRHRTSPTDRTSQRRR